MKKARIAALFVLTLITALMLTACGCKHEWAEATCKGPEECTLCGKTRGEAGEHEWSEPSCVRAQVCLTCRTVEGKALGHDWAAATCTAPSTCVRCGVTEGRALEHASEEWSVITEATCSEQGLEEGLCTMCQQVVTRVVETLPHTEGKYVVTKEATEDEKGEMTSTCTVCGAVVDVKEYELTAEEIEQRYKAQCSKYAYNDIARDPITYIGSYAKIYGKVLQVIREQEDDTIVYALRIGTSGYGYYDKVVYVGYTADASEPRILEDDMVTVYGMLMGEYTYESVLGNEITLPLMIARYVD